MRTDPREVADGSRQTFLLVPLTIRVLTVWSTPLLNYRVAISTVNGVHICPGIHNPPADDQGGGAKGGRQWVPKYVPFVDAVRDRTGAGFLLGSGLFARWVLVRIWRTPDVRWPRRRV